MSDKDLIRRGNAVKAVVNTMEKYFGTSSMIGVVNAVKHCLAELPTAPKEMSAREYVKVRRKICEKFFSADDDEEYPVYCCGCPLEDYCEGAKDDVDEEVAIVEKWAREHSEEANDER